MPTQLAQRCECGTEITLNDITPSGRITCPACGMTLKSAWNDDGAPPNADDGAATDSADQPGAELSTSGVMMLTLCGPFALIAGYLAAGFCVGGAVAINVFHNVLPRFYFIMPVIILLFLAVAPVVYGMGVGTLVGQVALAARHRHPETAGLFGLFWGIVGLVMFPGLAEAFAPNGQSFFPDILFPFVETMVGACVNMEWLEKPEPVDVAPWIIYTVLGIGAFMGVVCAFGQADDKVREQYGPHEDGDSLMGDESSD